MARPKSSKNALFEKYTLKYNWLTCCGDELFCKYCACIVTGDKEHAASRVNSHNASQKHQFNSRNNVIQPAIRHAINATSDQQRAQDEFKGDLAQALLRANIPINKIANPSLANFLKKWTKQAIPCTNTIRNHVKQLYDDTLNQIRSRIDENDVYLIIDETKDILERNQVNVMVGVLNGSPSKSMLLHVEYIDTCESEEFFRVFDQACCLLWNTLKPPYHRVRLLLSDQASNMIKAGRDIKRILCKTMLHVSCLAHCFNRVAITIKDNHPRTNKFVSLIREAVRLSRKRKLTWTAKTNLPLPPKPCSTRWTYWLRAAKFASENIERMEPFISSLKSECKTVRSLKKLIKSERLKEELFRLTDFYFLIEATDRIQSQSLRLSESAIIMKSVADQLERSKMVLEAPFIKFDKSIERNPDLEELMMCTDLAFKIKTKFAPVTSCDVERSFSITKKVLREDRCSFSKENQVMYYVLACNADDK